MNRLFVYIVIIVSLYIFPNSASSCPLANPNDTEPDDIPLQLCLNQGGTIFLDPGNPGYIIEIGLNITFNSTFITSSNAPEKATLIASPNLNYPILETSGIIFNISLSYLLVDGNKDNRAVRNAFNCIISADINYRTSNIMLPGFLNGGKYQSWNPFVFVDSVIIHDVDSINSPCGTGIGIQGRNFEIYHCNISDNGWDEFNNPQRLGFQYADGINAAVCQNGHIHDNLIKDNTNMQITAGPGPYCWVEKNIILQTRIVTQCSLNCWPTNIWLTTPVWWHPAPWNLAHSAITGNIINSTNTTISGAKSGIAVGGLPWNANITLTNTGLIYNNTISGAAVNLLVNGVTTGTIWGNTFSSPSFSNGKTRSMCTTPQEYTVAQAQSLYLQPGYRVLSFQAGRSCFATFENIWSTTDNAKFVNWVINGVQMPVSMNGTTGSKWIVSVTFLNVGSSVWQDIVGNFGYKVGITPATAPDWEISKFGLVNSLIYPSNSSTLEFILSIPLSPGEYLLELQMMQEKVSYFGEKTPALPITVTLGEPTFPTTGSPTTGPSTTGPPTELSTTGNSEVDSTASGGNIILEYVRLLSCPCFQVFAY